LTDNYDSNPLEIARRLGASIGGELGERAFQEMELAFVNAVLPKFSNNSLIRMRQHILLYWHQSYHKSTLINEFSRCIPDSIPQTNITSNTPETLFGSINEKNEINYPLFTNVRIVKISELSTFVTGRHCGEIVNSMNKILEGERVERQLLKLSRKELSDEEINNIVDRGINYDPFKGELSYTPDVSVFAGSRPLDNRTFTHLKSSGYFYRNHVIQKQLTDRKVERYLKKNYTPDQSLYGPLKTLNEKIASAKIKRINTPSAEITAYLMENLIDIAKDYSKHRKNGLSEIVDLRVKGDAIRELAAYSTILMLNQSDFKDIDKVEYSQEAVDFVADDIEHFIEARINPLFTEDLTKIAVIKHKASDYAKIAVLGILNCETLTSRGEIDANLLSARSNPEFSKATLSSALKHLVEEGKIENPKFGFYRKKKPD
jgi:hypothetical protein